MFTITRSVKTIFISEKNHKQKSGKKFSLIPTDWKYITKIIAIEFNLPLNLHIELYSCDNGKQIKHFKDLLNKGYYVFKTFKSNRNYSSNNYSLANNAIQKSRDGILNYKRKSLKKIQKSISENPEEKWESKFPSFPNSKMKMFKYMHCGEPSLFLKENDIFLNEITNLKIFDINLHKIMSHENEMFHCHKKWRMDFFGNRYCKLFDYSLITSLLSPDYSQMFHTTTVAIFSNETNQSREKHTKLSCYNGCHCTSVNDLIIENIALENECLCNCHCSSETNSYDPKNNENQQKATLHNNSNNNRVFELIMETIDVLNTLKKMQTDMIKIKAVKDSQIPNNSVVEKIYDKVSIQSESTQVTSSECQCFNVVNDNNVNSSLCAQSEILSTFCNCSSSCHETDTMNDNDIKELEQKISGTEVIKNEKIEDFVEDLNTKELNMNNIPTMHDIKVLYNFLLPVEENINKYIQKLEGILEGKEDEDLSTTKVEATECRIINMEDKEINTDGVQPLLVDFPIKRDVAVETDNIDEVEPRQRQKSNIFTSCFRFFK